MFAADIMTSLTGKPAILAIFAMTYLGIAAGRDGRHGGCLHLQSAIGLPRRARSRDPSPQGSKPVLARPAHP